MKIMGYKQLTKQFFNFRKYDSGEDLSKPVFSFPVSVFSGLFSIYFSFGAQALPISGNAQLLPGLGETYEIRNRPVNRPEPGAQVEILIGATSDLHGSLISRCPNSCKKAKGLLHLALVVERLRQSDPDILLLDAGDTLQGGAYNFYFNYVNAWQHQPHPVIEAMNEIGYDALTIGNHDFEIPRDVLLKAISDSEFPWLSANLNWTNTSISFSYNDDAANQDASSLAFTPYHVVHRKGVRIGIIGMITPGTPLWVDPEQHMDLHFEDMVKSVKYWKTILHENERVDLLIGLFHSGGNANYDEIPALKRGYPPPNASGLIADAVAGFDLIIAGHTHRTYPSRETYKLTKYRTPIVYPGSHAEGISLIKMTLIERKGRWNLRKSRYAYKKAEKAVKHSLYKKLEPAIQNAVGYMEEPTLVHINAAPDRLQLEECGTRLSHQAVTKKWGRDDLTLFPQRWYKSKDDDRDVNSPLRRRHLFNWIRYDNKPVLTRLYGRQMVRLLEPYIGYRSGRRVRSSAVLAPGGIIVRHNASGSEAYTRLINKEGFALGLKSLYRVWMTNYHWNGGSGIASRAMLHQTQLIRKEPFFLRDLVFENLSDPAMELPEECGVFLKK